MDGMQHLMRPSRKGRLIIMVITSEALAAGQISV